MLPQPHSKKGPSLDQPTGVGALVLVRLFALLSIVFLNHQLVLAAPPITNESEQLVASDAAAEDHFGWSTSFARDIASVGAPDDDSSKGAVYLFDRNLGGANNWGQVKKVVASDGAAGDQFGFAESINGLFLLVGAPQDGDSGAQAGSAYIFYEDQGGTDNWGQFKKLFSGDAAAGDQFGNSADLDGFIAAVGASSKNSQAGAVYLFERNQGGSDNWGQLKKLVASDAANGDRFGESVDVNGDWAIVGAPGNDDSASAAGSAYIFSKNQGGSNNWGQVKKLVASDPGANDFFGRSVAIEGSVAVVGGDVSNGGVGGPGAVYVFHKDQGGSNNWGQIKKVTASDGQNLDGLGEHVAISGEYLVASATGDDSYRGSVYLFMRNRGGPNYYGERLYCFTPTETFG